MSLLSVQTLDRSHMIDSNILSEPAGDLAFYEAFSKGRDVYIRVTNSDKTVEYENQALIERFGSGLGKPCYNIWNRQTPCDDCVSDRALKTKRPQSREEATLDGRIYLMVSIPISLPHHWTTVEIIYDITENRIAENINNILASSLDIRDIYNSIGKELNKVVNFDRMSITLMDEAEEGTCETFVLTKDYEHTEFKEGTHFPLKGSILERIMEKGGPVIVEDTMESVVETDKLLLKEGIRSRLALPLKYKGKVIGSLNFGSKRYRAFSEEHGRLLSQIIPQLAVAAENTRLFRKIKDSEEKYRGLIENSPSLIFACTRDGAFTLVSPSAEAFTGYSPYDFYVRTDLVPSLLHPDDSKKVRKEMEGLLKGEKPVSKNLEFRIIHRNGTVVWLSQDSYPLRDKNGNIAGIEGLCKDITEIKKIEEMKDTLMRDVSHELKTPLAKMEMSLHLYEEALQGGEGKDREKRKKVCDTLLSNLHRLKHAVQNILDLSSLESGHAHLKKEAIVLEELALRALKEVEEGARRKGLRFISSFPKEIPRLQADREMIYHVFLNLLDNSVKYTDKGVITVTARTLPEEVELSISDTGRGIEKDLLGRIFERFVQESPSFVGLGIGLSICKNIVQRHGGRIWAESEGKDKGTTFRFTLPLAQGERPHD